MCGAKASDTYKTEDEDRYTKGTRTPVLSDQWKSAYANAAGNLNAGGYTGQQQNALGLFQNNYNLLQDGIDDYDPNIDVLQGNLEAIQANNRLKPVQTSAGIINNDLMGNRGQMAALGGQYAPFSTQKAAQATASSGADFISRYTNDPTADALLQSSTDDYITTADRARNARLLSRDSSGAFGDRAAISDATYDADSVRGLNALTSGIRSSIYDRAVGAGMQDANNFTNTSQFNAGAEMQNRSQQMQAIQAQERNIAAQTGISQQILQNVITNNQVNMDGLGAESDAAKSNIDALGAKRNAVQINMDAATKLFQSGQISQEQLNQLAILAQQSNGMYMDETMNRNGSSNSFTATVDADIF